MGRKKNDKWKRRLDVLLKTSALGLGLSTKSLKNKSLCYKASWELFGNHSLSNRKKVYNHLNGYNIKKKNISEVSQQSVPSSPPEIFVVPDNVSEGLKSPAATPARSEMPTSTTIRAGASDAPAVVTCWGSPMKTRRKILSEFAPPVPTVHTLEQEDSLSSPAIPHVLHFQPLDDNTVPPRLGLTSRMSPYPGSLGNRSAGRSQGCKLQGNESNSRGKGTVKKNLMKTYNNPTKTSNWRGTPAVAKVNEELRAEKQGKDQAENSKKKPRREKQGKCAEKATEQTAETSRSRDIFKEYFVHPEVDHMEVPCSRPMTWGARQARKRAIIAYKKSVWALKIHLADYNIEEPQVNGLVNLGVTCFLNSILQCLARTPLFLKELIRTFDEQTIQLPGDPSKGVEGLQVSLDSWGPVTHKLANRITALLLRVSSENPVNPDILVQILEENLEIEFKHQQDAQELLIILLETLREEYEVKFSAKIEEAIKPKFTSKEDANRALQIYEQQARQAAFGPTVLFQGLVTYTIRCDTLKDSVARSESFTTLSLPIASSRKRRSVDMPLSPTKRSMYEENVMNICERTEREEGAVEPEPVEEQADHLYTLHSCLQQFMAAQCMTDYNCSCKKSPKEGGKHTMQSEIKVAPRILVLHLKRFMIDDRSNIKKIDVHVSFPSILNIADFCDANCRGSGNVLYGLYGVVHHSGTPTGGHFIADVKVRHPRYLLNGTLPNDTQWYVMDDGNATKTSESCVLRRQAYLLFYEKLVQ